MNTIKRIEKIISKEEVKLSKKNNYLYKSKTDNKELKLYREILNIIDKYMWKEKDTAIYRHYRYKVIRFGNDKIKKYKEV